MRFPALILAVLFSSLSAFAQCGAGQRWIINPFSNTIYCIPASGSTTPTEPGYSPNQIISGCGVAYTGTGLQFTVGACTYTINGQTYTSPLTNITLDAADGTNPRFDLIAVDTTNAAIKVTGTAAAAPAFPTIDPTTQLGLTFVSVPAGATTPGGITTDLLYDEGVEWTLVDTANIDNNTTANAYTGSKAEEATNADLTNNFQLTNPSGLFNVETRQALVIYVRSKGTWPANRQVAIWWQNGANQRGEQVVLRDGNFNFDSSITNVYQQVFIPISLFVTRGRDVDRLRVQVGGSGSGTIGWYMDRITLQAGFTVVDPPGASEGLFGITIDGGGSAISTGIKGDVQIPYGCIVTGWTLLADQSGSITLDLWKDSYANYPPTVADTITGTAKPLISAATKNTSTTLTGWNLIIASGDTIRFNVDSATTITRATLLVRCTKT